MAGNNLDITIGADTSKARAEIALLNAQMRATQKEIKATADTAVKTGDPKALANLKALSAAYDGMSKKLVVLRKEVSGADKALTEHTKHSKEHAHGFYLVENSLQSLNGALMAVGHNLGGAKLGIAGFAAGIVGTKIVDHINEVSEALKELKKQAGEIGIRPVALQGMQQVAKQAGHDADDATKFMQGLGRIIEENRQKFGAPVGDAGLPPVLKGGTLETPMPGRIGFPGGPSVRVGRGGVPGETDPTKMLDDLDLRLFEKNAAGIEKAARAVQHRLLELQKTMNALDFNIFAKAKFGMSGQALGEMANDMQKLEEAIKKLQGLDPDQFKRNDALLASQGKLEASFEAATANMTAKATEARIFINNELAKFFDESSFSANLNKLSQQWAYFWGGLKGPMAQAAEDIQTTLSALWGAASRAAASVGQALGAATEQAVIPGLARGGYVTGPGSGTSDSILARLSAGEFVVNAARVRQVGLGFLQQLNGFADGGFVGLSSPRLPKGGLVSAPASGGGSHVTVVLDGLPHHMHADDAVAQSLLRTANRVRMSSAGVKPSWYGGR